jgi:hypothetical protein
MKILKPLIVITLLAMLGCSQPIEKTARDGIATASGVIKQYQSQYKAECTAQPTGAACVTINRAIAANNTAIDALEAYCGFSPGADLAAACKPVASAKDGLSSALANLQNVLNDVRRLK